MSAFQHPAFPEIVERVDDGRDDEMAAAGWVPLLNPEQKQRLNAIERAVEIDALESELSPRE